MIYKNGKTGAVIDSPCIISGGDWKPIKVKSEATEETKKTRRTKKED